ncbi:hypothetical protein RIF29_14897 [Crotalaria pallida]|uniref:Uncharacterized protein n=1 Tax=Crotalaria pallida TaxID=3830 RepID=A0AAN9IAQ5_CROPI
MLLVGFTRAPPLMPFVGSKCSVENQLMEDYPPITLGLLKSVDNPGTYTVYGTIVGVSLVNELPPYPSLLSVLIGFQHTFKVEVCKCSVDSDDMQYVVDGKGKSALIANSIEINKKPIKRSLAFEFDAFTDGPSPKSIRVGGNDDHSCKILIY